jgi:neutral ceramidase
MRHFFLLSLLFLLVASAGLARPVAGPAAAKGLAVGAAKVNITPALSELPSGFLGIYDSLYSRAIVVRNNNQTVALVTVDYVGLSQEVAGRIIQKIGKLTAIPPQHIMLTATHTHSVPFGYTSDGFETKIARAVQLAQQKMQPAKMGYGTGVSYLNVNRNRIDPVTRRWAEGPNYEGFSDKTVAVLTFETLAGQPIAVYYNYAMHAVISGMFDMVCADVPGATSRYLEEAFDNKIVAAWSTGACGDQNPIYYQQTYDLRALRIQDYAKKGVDISNKMPPGGQGLDRANPQVAKLMQQQRNLLTSMGQLLGEEVLHTMRTIPRLATQAAIYADQRAVVCPGRKRLDEGRAGYPGTYADGDSVTIKLGLLVVGDVAFTAVNGEVFSPIFSRLKKLSPYANTLMLTLTNGNAKTGYIPNDAAFGTYTFEVLSSRLKPGYAEDAIVNGLLDMLRRSFAQTQGR